MPHPPRSTSPIALLTLIVAAVIAAALPGCASTGRAADGEGAPTGRTVRTGLVTLRGEPVTLEGGADPLPRVGRPAPDFVAVANDMSERRLSDYRGRVVILSTVPSIDTPLCDLETRTFNERTARLPDDVIVLTVSMDLPFAQRRWCGAHGIDRVVTLSDFKHRAVADAYGLRIRETGLLARAVYVIDAAGVLRSAQIVPEITTEPDYDAALDAARQAVTHRAAAR